LPHAPQLAWAPITSTQALPHLVKPDAQPELHLPSEHTWVAGHALLHAPQLLGFEAVSTQLAPHAVVVAAQPHFPALHAWPTKHAAPHAPQFALSVLRFRHSAPHSVLWLVHVALGLPPLFAPPLPAEVPTPGAVPALPPAAEPARPCSAPPLAPTPPAAACCVGPAELAHASARLPAPRSDTRLNGRVRLSIVFGFLRSETNFEGLLI